jgi:hypothetical protein
MKSRLLYTVIFLSTLVISCQKSNNATTTPPPVQGSSNAIFTFNVNDTLSVDWSGQELYSYSELASRSLNGHMFYYLRALNGDYVGNDTADWDQMEISFPTDNLVVGDYSSKTTTTSDLRIHHSSFIQNESNGDSVELHITSIHDGMVDGVFSSDMSMDKPATHVRTGVFKNVPISKPMQ